jgi:hypothetical protein
MGNGEGGPSSGAPTGNAGSLLVPRGDRMNHTKKAAATRLSSQPLGEPKPWAVK